MGMPLDGGMPCEYKSSEEYDDCPRICHRRTFCAWAAWSDWDACSVTCGQSAYRKRRRRLTETRVATFDFEASQEDYDELVQKVQYAKRSRLQGLALAFACGCASFVLLLSAGRAFRFASGAQPSTVQEVARPDSACHD